MAKWWLIIALFLFGCSSVNKRGLYEPVAAVGGYGLFKPSEKKICNCNKNSAKIAQEKLTEEGYKQLSDGITASVICVALSLFMANPVIQRLGNYGLMGACAWVLSGLLKIATATVLPYVIFGVIASVVIGILYWARKKGIDNWIKEKWSTSIPVENHTKP
ncbi:MAG: hypothetical protein ACTSQA_05260 [Candidatus Heimdallarchaeaceae archaeon]